MKRIAITLLSLSLAACEVSQLEAGDMTISEVDGMEMVFVPAGEFVMGSADGNKQADEDEYPAHKVYVGGFWIDRTEVTNAMYVLCMKAEACQAPARSQFYLLAEYAEHPVLGVSWGEANAYCGWAGRRLVSEAEWEKAARGTDGRIYPWGDESPSGDVSNFGQLVGETMPVGSFPNGASPYGALDMAGNVWEWTADGYAADFYARSPFENPVSDAPVNQRVLRGGNWDSNADGVRATNRFWAFPGRNDIDGFRCAKSE